jgi:hypothetical protein
MRGFMSWSLCLSPLVTVRMTAMKTTIDAIKRRAFAIAAEDVART